MSLTKIQERNRTIIRYNAAGIALNGALSVVKLITGVSIHSKTVILDAANGLADMLSSAISIIMTFLTGRKANHEHPLGFGRLEYISSMIITSLILVMGIRAIYTAILDIIHNNGKVHYDLAVIIIMIISLVVKLLYGRKCIRKGHELNCISLIMIGKESMDDSFVSVIILVSILVYRVSGVDIEPYVCIFIAALIVRTAILMLRETVNSILGTKVKPETLEAAKKLIIEEDGVSNVFNLVIHNYGEGVLIGSVDIEVDEHMTAGQIRRLTANIIEKAKTIDLNLTAVGIIGSSLSSPAARELWDRILEIVAKNDRIIRAHGFYADFEKHYLSFLVLTKPSGKDGSPIPALAEEVRSVCPGMTVDIRTILAE